MFDDLRKSANEQSGFPEDSDAELEPLLNKNRQGNGRGFNMNGSNFLGMNAFQRFILSALFLLLVCILGIMLVMITSTSVPF